MPWHSLVNSPGDLHVLQSCDPQSTIPTYHLHSCKICFSSVDSVRCRILNQGNLCQRWSQELQVSTVDHSGPAPLAFIWFSTMNPGARSFILLPFCSIFWFSEKLKSRSFSPWFMTDCVTNCHGSWKPLVFLCSLPRPVAWLLIAIPCPAPGSAPCFPLLAFCMPSSFQSSSQHLSPASLLLTWVLPTTCHWVLLQNICFRELVNDWHTFPQHSACSLPATPHSLVFNCLLYALD